MDAIKKTVHENFGGAFQQAADAENQFSLKDVPDVSGKVALITGGSDGIGFATGHWLLKQNLSKLVIVSENKEKYEKGLDVIKKDLGESIASRVSWHQNDMADWTATQQLADKIGKELDRLDILCLNAARGIMTYQLAENGVDRHMAANHVGHVVLTSHLLPLLKKTAEKDTVRIVSMSSNAHQASPKDTKFESLEEMNQDLGPQGQYGRAKLANLLYARWLNKHVTKENPKILANATHPGFVETTMSVEDIHEPYPILGYVMSTVMKPVKKEPQEGALSMLYAATVTNKSGQYICPPATVEEGSDLSRDETLAENLMKLTNDLVAQKTGAQKKGCPLDATDGIDPNAPKAH